MNGILFCSGFCSVWLRYVCVVLFGVRNVSVFFSVFICVLCVCVILIVMC